MYKGKKIGVFVPAYNEERNLAGTVRGIPDFVDSVVIVDDCSVDGTPEVARSLCEESSRVEYVRHDVNRGAGGAARTGHEWCRDHGLDVAVNMNGDGQMDPADLPALLDPVVADHADFSKGNRLYSPDAWRAIPAVRLFGNSVLSFLTKIASGYWHVADSQTGYTAMGRRALETLPFQELFPRYGFPNHLLVLLNTYDFRVTDVPIKALYNVGEQSKMNVRKVVFSLSARLFRWFVRRMFLKYVVRDFHPLVLFYLLGAFSLVVDVGFIVQLVYLWVLNGHAPPLTALAIAFFTITGLQSILFAMLFDMEANRDLRGRM